MIFEIKIKEASEWLFSIDQRTFRVRRRQAGIWAATQSACASAAKVSP
jgi:hypothetical protein